jgi:hypothetical protein
MKPRTYVVLVPIPLIVLAILLVITLSTGPRTVQQQATVPALAVSASVKEPATSLPTPDPTIMARVTKIHPKRTDLVHASPETIGNLAKKHAQTRLRAQGTMNVLLSQPITREQVANLGLGCLPDFASIEEPPLALVILKGNFSFESMPGGESLQGTRFPYVVYVIDLWSGDPVKLMNSISGGLLRKALNDPSLPFDEESTSQILECTPRRPGSAPYGAEVPGLPVPAYTAVPYYETDEFKAAPTAPVPTENTVPGPVPSAVVDR